MSAAAAGAGGASTGAGAGAVAETKSALAVRFDPDLYGKARLQEYKLIKFLGKGAFAEVHEYERKRDGVHVAIKQVFHENREGGVNLGAIKEMQVLLEVSHPNVIQLYDVFPYEGKIFMALEKASTDLKDVIENRSIYLSPADVKSFLHMILLGVAYCHEHWFMHRDIKPENLLIAEDGMVKLGDFGHATALAGEDRSLYPTVVTIWYRAPELLFGASYYSEAVDIWSVGCVFAEMLLRRAMFPGQGKDAESERLNQIAQIVRLMGTPDPEDWKGVELLPNYVVFPRKAPESLAAVFPELDATGLDLMRRMLTYNPSKRISAHEALEHPYFSSDPAPTPAASLPIRGFKAGKK